MRQSPPSPSAQLQIGIRSDVLRKNLDGDRPVQAGIGGLVDFAHAARTDRGSDLIGAESSAGPERHLSEVAADCSARAAPASGA